LNSELIFGNVPVITAFHEHRTGAAVSSSASAQLWVLVSLDFILGSRGGSKAKRLADEAEQRSRMILRTPRPRKREEFSQGG
jgi:hypothetical protein